MIRFRLRGLLSLLFLSAVLLRAEVINYQGRLKVDGLPFNGAGRFRFSLVDPRGAAVWTTGDMLVSVTDGRYAVRLGDSPLAPAIDAALLQGPNAARLRIWVQRPPAQEWIVVGPDIAFAQPAAAPVAGPTNDAVLAELRAIRVLLANRAPAAAPREPEKPQIVSVSVAGAPSLGNASAPVVLVEFTDFQCPFCIKFQNDVFGQLKARYVDTGKLRVISMHLPLPFHPFATPAAKAAICAEAQGRFWEMREKLFAAGGELGGEAIGKLVRSLGLDEAKFNLCTASGEITAALAKEGQDAKAAGIEATPTFVLGQVSDGKVTGLKIIGVMPVANFIAEIDRLLEKKG